MSERYLEQLETVRLRMDELRHLYTERKKELKLSGQIN